MGILRQGRNGLVLVLVSATAIGCGGADLPSTPSDTGLVALAGDGGVVIESQGLVMTSPTQCSIAGRLRNTNQFAIFSVEVDWRALDVSGRQLAAAETFESFLLVPPAGSDPSTREFLDPFSPDVPCSAIARVDRSRIQVIAVKP
jgi:hypothetical protein